MAERDPVVGFRKDQPSNGLSPHRSATVFAVADDDAVRLAGDEKTNRTAATPSRYILHRIHLDAPYA